MSRLHKVGLTWDVVRSVAEFYGLDPTTVWRYSVGKRDWRTAHTGVLNALRSRGWLPPGGLAKLDAELALRTKAMPPLDSLPVGK